MKFKIGLVAASLFGALAASPAASAMPIAPAPATPQVSDVEQVRLRLSPLVISEGALGAPSLLRDRELPAHVSAVGLERFQN